MWKGSQEDDFSQLETGGEGVEGFLHGLDSNLEEERSVNVGRPRARD